MEMEQRSKRVDYAVVNSNVLLMYGRKTLVQLFARTDYGRENGPPKAIADHTSRHRWGLQLLATQRLATDPA